MEYRKEVDGLRALAVIPVMLFHAGFDAFKGGFLGVDIFFVISGFLISSIMFERLDAGEFSLVSFYRRRVLRILPALYLTILISFPAAWLTLSPMEFIDFATSIASTLSFSSNFYFWYDSNYFAASADLKPFLHSWSLSVEEQYYLLFPVLMMGIWRYFKGKFFLVLILLSSASLMSAHFLGLRSDSAAFFLLVSRAWQLLVGVLAAAVLRSYRNLVSYRAVNQFCSLFGFVLVIVALLLFDKSTNFPWVSGIVPTLGASLILVFGQRDTLVSAVLSCRLPVKIGLVSYSAYLLHQPVFAFSRHRFAGDIGADLAVLLLFLVLGMAFLSWKFVEQPFRTGFYRAGNGKLLVLTSLSTIFLLVLSLSVYLFEGFKQRQAFYDPKISGLIEKYTSISLSNDMLDDDNCKFWSPDINQVIIDRYDNCIERFGRAVIVLGDSHAMNVYNAFFLSNQFDFLVGFAKPGCRPGNDEPRCHYSAFSRFLNDRSLSIDRLFFNQAGFSMVEDKNRKGLREVTVFPGRIRNDQPSLIGHKVEAVIDYLSEYSKKVNVTWLGPFHESRLNVGNLLALRVFDYKMNAKSLEMMKEIDRELKEIVRSKVKSFGYRSLVDLMEIDEGFLIVNDCLSFRDHDHLSRCGEEFLAKRLKTFSSGFEARP